MVLMAFGNPENEITKKFILCKKLYTLGYAQKLPQIFLADTYLDYRKRTNAMELFKTGR